MKSGLATCTGLSILLVNACRAVGVPARVVGTRMWTNMRGNHTWVEIWDGDWHFLGAAEPDPKGLDRGWFVSDASKAKAEVTEHAIHASSFRKTGLAFPLMWDANIKWVPAVNITNRYAANTASQTGKVRVLLRVLDRVGGKRISAQVTVTDSADASIKAEGTSRSESSDLNDIASFSLDADRTYFIALTQSGKTVRREIKTKSSSDKEQMVTVAFEDQ